MARSAISSNGKFEFKFPFEPPWEDLRMEGTTPGGIKFYVFDSCVERDPEKRAEIDRRIAKIFVDSERRKFLAKLAEEEAAEAGGA